MSNGIIPIREGSIPPEVVGYMDNARLMHEIVRSMREIPVLESEKPTDNNALTQVEFPEEGGILTHMTNHEYPYRGFPYFEFVDKIDTFKKLSRGILSGLYHSLKGSKLKLLLAFPLLFVCKDLVSAGLYTYHNLIVRLRVKSHLYSTAIRELYRVFDLPREKEDLKTLELRMMLKDLFCMVLEFDNAYRYRFQDIIVELDQGAIKKDTVKELLRLLDVMSPRENDQKVKDTWYLFKLVVRFYLKFDKRLTKMLADVLSNIDLKLVALTPEDKHFSCQRSDYAFGFMKNPTVEDQKIIDRCLLKRKHNEDRAKLDQELAVEFQSYQLRQQQEQRSKINLSEDLKKKIQDEVAAVQKALMDQHIAASQEIPSKYLTQEQKDLLKNQQEELIELSKQHDLRRSQLAASYGF